MPRWSLTACLMIVTMLAGGVHAARAESMEEQGKAKLQDWIGGDKAQYFRLPPFNISVIRDGRPYQEVSLSIAVEAKGINNKNKIIKKRVELQSAFLRDLYAVLSLRDGNRRPLDVNTVKIRLRRVADHVLGPGVVDGVLVESAYTRYIN